MISRGRHRRHSRAGTAVGAGFASAAIIAGSAAGASASTFPAPSSSSAPVSSEHPLRAVADAIRATQPLTVTVKSGDTLSKIAESSCGNAADWSGIWAANKKKIPDWNLIFPEQVLTVTCRTAKLPVVTVSYTPPRHQAAVQPQGNVSTAGMSGFQACVIRAESGGRTQVMNSSGHYGLYQFSSSTWAAHGGNPADFGHASAAEQTQVFWSTVRDDGTSDWSPYDGC